MSFLWPTKNKAEPTILGRLGRVLHWSLTLLAVPAALIGLWMLFSANAYDGCVGPTAEACETADWWAGQLRSMGTYALLAAAGSFIVGRVSRYVLSGE